MGRFLFQIRLTGGFMTDTDERIRQRAYQLWQQEGCPEGRETAHWEKPRELVAIEDNQMATTKPIDQNLGPEGEPIEEARWQQNYGEFPTLTDQGESEIPHRPDEPVNN
jgi:hypothetical protein